ncbi:MAG: DNA polymerase ligase N-terminal domain-containing protein [Phycisphaerae bacterium]
MDRPLRYVLLEHTPPRAFGPDQEPFEKHWDLMLEQPDKPGLATWRLTEDPLHAEGAIKAVRLPDHRNDYLDIEEAELSGNRGVVVRRDVGQYTLISKKNGDFALRLAGDLLQGRYVIRNEHFIAEME